MKWCFREVVPGIAAIVSCHGYFEIQRADSYNSYASGIGPVYHRNEDGTHTQLPNPVVLAEGGVDELGLTYNARYDDLEEDDEQTIRTAVIRYIEANGISA